MLALLVGSVILAASGCAGDSLRGLGIRTVYVWCAVALLGFAYYASFVFEPFGVAVDLTDTVALAVISAYIFGKIPRGWSRYRACLAVFFCTAMTWIFFMALPDAAPSVLDSHPLAVSLALASICFIVCKERTGAMFAAALSPLAMDIAVYLGDAMIYGTRGIICSGQPSRVALGALIAALELFFAADLIDTRETAAES